MKIYLAASFTRQKTDAAGVAAFLRRAGHHITSRWLDEEPEYESGDMSKHAVVDVEDVTAGEAVVCLTGDTASRGGRHSEVGIAIAQGKKVYLLGPREQVFHWHPLVTPVETIEKLLPLLGKSDEGGMIEAIYAALSPKAYLTTPEILAVLKWKHTPEQVGNAINQLVRLGQAQRSEPNAAGVSLPAWRRT